MRNTIIRRAPHRAFRLCGVKIFFSIVLFLVLLAGGNWSNGANCSSQARNANNARANANTNVGSQGRRHRDGRVPTLRLDAILCRVGLPTGKTQNREASLLVVSAETKATRFFQGAL
jgi:hypothetical protein